MRMRREQIVIVGAGRAGVAAAEELRMLGFDGDLVILHDEEDPPYDRPSCAKGLLTGHSRPSDVTMPIMPGVDAYWKLGRTAVHLDTEAHMVITDTDEVFEYDGLVIASGAYPMSPPGWPIGEPGLHVLYRMDDAWRLRSELRWADSVAVVGGGLTGCEVASAVRGMARDCYLIDSKPYPMSGPLGEHVGRMVGDVMQADGVRMRSGRRVAGLNRGRHGGWTLILDDGEEITVDIVVAATGERPDTRWMQECPDIDTTDGVLCDEALRVIGAEDVVAAGTVARWPNLQYSAEPRRTGQWITALEHGRAAARTLLSKGHPVEPVTHMPRFWSEQFGLRIQVCGQTPSDAQIAITEMRPGRPDVARAGVLVGYHQEGAMVGLAAVNAPGPFTPMARAMLANAGPTVSSAPIAPAAQTTGDPRRRLLAAVS
jgi:NADPH-dependent 2,4-dienoyl-CoA reductase/sulfur reductase-like enzyme